MHTARMWMASATPGGVPGYDDDEKFGNNITHCRSQTSQRLRGLYGPIEESQARAQILELSGFLAFGESESAWESHGRRRNAVT